MSKNSVRESRQITSIGRCRVTSKRVLMSPCRKALCVRVSPIDRRRSDCGVVPFLLAEGAMQYPAKKFLVALTLGRIFRYMILAYLAARYGRHIISFIAANGHPLIGAIILVLIATAAGGYYF
jgi:hypothetical protein